MNAATETLPALRTLVVGLGTTGLSVARFLQRNGEDAVFLDSRETPPGLDELGELWPDAELHLGADTLPNKIDRVVASPGISDSNALLAAARKQSLEVVSDIELFTAAATAPFVGITGSNGKSTVTTLVYHMCRADGRHVLAGGNLGEPALDLLAHDQSEARPDGYVLELSSFQLQRTANLPADVAVLLNISPDHLDWHRDEDEYRAAKYRIFNEARRAVVNREDEKAAQAARHVDTVISFGADAPAEDQFGIRSIDGSDYLACGNSLLLATHELGMVGRHNQLNALAALAVGSLLELDMSAMLQVLTEFPGLEHRMQRVATVDGVDYINDSKATNVGAAVASIESLTTPVVLIAGGDGKGGQFTDLAAPLQETLRAAVLIGRDAEAIAAALDTVQPVRFAKDMTEAVALATAEAQEGDTVLLAPACASFDQFDNYMQRGDAFAAAVRGLSS